MSFTQWFFPVATVALSVALWSCWRNGKPARKAAAEERERKYQAHLDEVRAQKEQQFAADVLSVLNDIYTGRIEAGKRQLYNHEYEYKHPMVQLLQDLKGNNGTIKRILGRADRTHDRMNELENGLHDIRVAMRPYHPNASPANEFPTIRKG